MEEYTLRANEGICQSMIILLGISTLITAYIALRSMIIKTKWHRDPATVLGSLTFFQIRKGYHTELTKNGPRCEEEKLKWSDSESSLPILTSKFRVVFTLYSLALIGGLAATLRRSQTAEGLATVGEATNISLWWRVIPALAMFMVTVYINAVDYTIRDLATSFLLSVQECNLNQLDDSLLDMLGFRALICSLQRKFYAITFSQVQVTICAFLVTLSSLLFTTEIKPGYTDTEFQLSSWFANRAVSFNRSITFSDSIRSLVFQQTASNFSYPKNTYADLLFPAIDIDSKLQSLDSSNSIVIETPAAKLVPTCFKVPENQYNISISDWDVNSSVRPHFGVRVSQDFSCPHSPGDGGTGGIWGQDQFELPTGQKSVYVGRLIQTPENLDSILCGTTVGPNWSLRTYLWGGFSREKGAFDYVTVWKCNYTWAEVKSTVEMVYSNENLVIDHSRPPTKDQNEMRLWDPPFPVPPVTVITQYGQNDRAFPTLQNSWNATGNFLSEHFQGILEPYGSITREDLGTPGREAQILDALNYRLGSVSVQLANKDCRLSLNETSSGSLSKHPTLPPVYAKIRNNKRMRLFQDSKVTIAIIAILAVVVFVNMWALISALLKRRFANGKRPGWLLDMEFKGLVPDGFGSISSMYHLLDGSNMLHQIPHQAHLMSQEQLAERAAGVWFRMGWFWNTEDQKMEYTIGALGDEEFQFLVEKTEVIS